MKSCLISVIGLTTLLISCSQDGGQNKQVRSVVTATVETLSGEESRSLTGVVKEDATVNVGFLTGGQLQNICVKEGQRVKQGQKLAQLNDKDYRLGVDAVEAQYNQVSSEVERMKILLDSKSVSINDYAKAEAGAKQLKAQLQSNRNKLSYTTLDSPLDGIIKKVNFEVSEMVDAGTPVFEILSQGPIKVELSIPASLYEKRTDIASVSVIYDGKVCKASILNMIPEADATQLYKTTISVAADKRLTPGRSVAVQISLRNETGAAPVMYVPASSVFNQEGKSMVWVLNQDSTVSAREVVIGKNPSGDMMMIESGVNAGETVIRAGVHHLNEGEKVHVMEPVSETNVGGLL